MKESSAEINAFFSPDEYRVFIEAVAQRQRCATVDDFYAAIGYGGIIPE